MSRSVMDKLAAYAAEFGATVNLDERRLGYATVEAPDGMLWACDDLQSIVVVAKTDSGMDWPGGVEDAIARMKCGLVPESTA